MKIRDMCEYGSKSKIKAGEGQKIGKYKFFTSSSACNKYLDIAQFEIPGIIMGTGGNATLHYCSDKFSVSTDCVVLFPKNNIDCKYLYYFFKKNMQILEEGFKGAGLRHTNKNYINNIVINKIPSICEQSEMVKVLDRVQLVINMKEQQLEELDMLVKSRFVEMFGDILINDKKCKLKRLSEISTSRLGKMLDQKKKYGFSQKKYLANFNVQWFEFVLENLNTMEFSEKEIKEFELLKGDILMCEGGEVGRCAIWKGELEDVYFQKALHRIRLQKDTILPEYFTYYMYLRATITKFNEIVGTATISHLTGVQLKAIEVPVPPLDLQNQFVTFIQATDKLKVELQKSLDEMQLLFDSLMQQYFE